MVTDKFFVRFKDYISFEHLKSMCLIEIAKTREEVLEAIDCSQKVIEKVENLPKPKEESDQVNFGFYHSYSVNVIRGFEEGYLNRPQDNKYFNQAKQYAEKSIECDEKYGKFHCTLGRLYLLEKIYDQAIEEFRKAIDYEDSLNEDYILRVNEYQNYIFRARTYNMREIKNEMEKINNENIIEMNKKIENIKAHIKKEIEDEPGNIFLE